MKVSTVLQYSNEIPLPRIGHRHTVGSRAHLNLFNLSECWQFENETNHAIKNTYTGYLRLNKFWYNKVKRYEDIF